MIASFLPLGASDDIVLDVPPSLRRRIERAAAAEGRTVSAYIQYHLTAFFKARKEQP